jgi:hypothetical protein
MLSKKSTTTSLLAALALGAAAQTLDKPVISPQFYDELDPRLDNFPQANYQITDFQEGYIPQDCKSMYVIAPKT